MTDHTLEQKQRLFHCSGFQLPKCRIPSFDIYPKDHIRLGPIPWKSHHEVAEYLCNPRSASVSHFSSIATIDLAMHTPWWRLFAKVLHLESTRSQSSATQFFGNPRCAHLLAKKLRITPAEAAHRLKPYMGLPFRRARSLGKSGAWVLGAFMACSSGKVLVLRSYGVHPHFEPVLLEIVKPFVSQGSGLVELTSPVSLADDVEKQYEPIVEKVELF